jgi:hypothetical protein
MRALRLRLNPRIKWRCLCISSEYERDLTGELKAKEDYAREYYLRNRDDISKSRQEHYVRNKDIICEAKRTYYLLNKDSVIGARREYYRRNKDSMKESMREYHRTYYFQHKNHTGEDVYQFQRERICNELRKRNREEANRAYYLRNKDKNRERESYIRAVKKSAGSTRLMGRRSLKTPALVRDYIEALGKQLHISDYTDWYRISRTQITNVGGLFHLICCSSFC